jgi:hypothetical protein
MPTKQQHIGKPYRVVKGDSWTALEYNVNFLMKHGYEPIGGVSVDRNVHSQAMVKRENSGDELYDLIHEEVTKARIKICQIDEKKSTKEALKEVDNILYKLNIDAPQHVIKPTKT